MLSHSIRPSGATKNATIQITAGPSSMKVRAILLRRRCGLAARARAERAFRLDDFAADVIGFYEEVLSGAPL